MSLPSLHSSDHYYSPPPTLTPPSPPAEMIMPFAHLVEFQAFSWQELVAATDNFQRTLGKGTFGEVFEGSLPGGTQIAVKRLRPMAVQEEIEQFQREIRCIAAVNHKNILRVLGFSVDGDPLLVSPKLYSLHKALYDNGSEVLSWNDRYRIALGVAKGLAYLHTGARVPMVHCDIKPGNILLDLATLEPYIADFGVVHLLPQGGDEILNAATLYGTPGYMAPELRSQRRFSVKSDVYSFGVLLYALVSGEERVKHVSATIISKKRMFASLITNQGEVWRLINFLCLWARSPATTVSLFSNFFFFGGVQLKDVDERVRGCVRDSPRAVVQAYKALDLIALCIQDDPELRPHMERVALILDSANICDIPMPLVWLSQRSAIGKGRILAWILLLVCILTLLLVFFRPLAFIFLCNFLFCFVFVLMSTFVDKARLYSYPRRMISQFAIPAK